MWEQLRDQLKGPKIISTFSARPRCGDNNFITAHLKPDITWPICNESALYSTHKRASFDNLRYSPSNSNEQMCVSVGGRENTRFCCQFYLIIKHSNAAHVLLQLMYVDATMCNVTVVCGLLVLPRGGQLQQLLIGAYFCR